MKEMFKGEIMKLYLSLLFIALAFLISATPQQTRILSQNDLNCI